MGRWWDGRVASRPVVRRVQLACRSGAIICAVMAGRSQGSISRPTDYKWNVVRCQCIQRRQNQHQQQQQQPRQRKRRRETERQRERCDEAVGEAEAGNQIVKDGRGVDDDAAACSRCFCLRWTRDHHLLLLHHHRLSVHLAWLRVLISPSAHIPISVSSYLMIYPSTHLFVFLFLPYPTIHHPIYPSTHLIISPSLPYPSFYLIVDPSYNLPIIYPSLPCILILLSRRRPNLLSPHIPIFPLYTHSSILPYGLRSHT